MRKPSAGGGWPAIWYVLQKSRAAGGWIRMWKAMRSRNACKTCALGMGGQQGGMVNERGSFPEVCKKSIQAMAADMQGAIGDEFWQTWSLDQLRQFTPYQLEHAGRLVAPMLWEAGRTHYVPISWDRALEIIVDELKQTSPDESFWYFSGRSSNEAGFLLQLVARIYGTNNVNNCSYYCHQASGVALASSIGTGTATIVLEDIEHADLVFVIGGNPASNHPRLMSTLKHVRRRGGKVIVINPVVETGLVRFKVPSDPMSLLFGTRIATRYVQPHIGGDLALLTGIAKRLDEIHAINHSFLQLACDGHDDWLQGLREMSWRDIVAISGVDQTEIQAIADDYAAAKNCVFCWTMGITHHTHGVQNVQAIANLALARGMVGRPNAGLLPIRGHSNVQGIGSVGVTPQLKNALLSNLKENYHLQLPTTPGADTLTCMEHAAAGRMRTAFCLGGNLYGSNPDARFARDALSKLELIVYLNTTLNTGHAHGTAKRTVILPVLARDEEPQPTTQESMFNFVRLSDGGPARHVGPRSEIEVIAEVAERLLGPERGLDWGLMRQTHHIRQAIAKVVPGWQALETIDRTKKEFQIAGRTLHEPKFPTENGRARMYRHELIPSTIAENELRLMTVRSEGQFNTVVYEEVDLYRGQDRRDVILVHPTDLERLGLTNHQRVTVRSEVGAMHGILIRAYRDIRPGNALMYYPEANALVPRHADPASRTPAFKNIHVTIEALGQSRNRDMRVPLQVDS